MFGYTSQQGANSVLCCSLHVRAPVVWHHVTQVPDAACHEQTRDSPERSHSKDDSLQLRDIKGRIYGDITKHCGSFVGRDFKAWAQIAPFIICPHLTDDELFVWLSLSKVRCCCFSHPTLLSVVTESKLDVLLMVVS